MTDDMPGTGIDTTVPHSARIWNYWLGGKDNYAVDREAGDDYAKLFPGIRKVARDQRAFLARSVAYLAGQAGVRQFLDVGTGLPTADNTHQVAQRVAPDSRIVYVDNDPLVLAHARALLTSTPEGATAFIEADLHAIDTIMSEAARTLDFSQPIVVILHGILGHIPDTREAQALVRNLMNPLMPGSYLDLADGARSAGEWDEAQADYNESGAAPYVLRNPDEITGFFDGLVLVPPGVVPCPEWRPDLAGGDQAAEADTSSGVALGGVARKP